MKPTVSIIITDIDNTLFDWFDHWYQSFQPVYHFLQDTVGLPRSVLDQEIKRLHLSYQTSEVPWFGSELLTNLSKSDPQYPANLETIREIEKTVSQSKFTPYATVPETLSTLKQLGVSLIGYSESQEFNTTTRLHKLALDGLLDIVYCRATVREPAHIKADHRLKNTTVQLLDPTLKKPDPAILTKVLRTYDVSPRRVAFVGDSLSRDIAMAQKCNLHDVFASYGVATSRPEYDLLRRITHWTANEVAHEAAADRQGTIHPTFVLKDNFAELLDLFNFGPLEGFSKAKDDILLLYRTSIDVQKHFNELQLKTRAMGLTLLAAFLGLSSFAFDNNTSITIFGNDISIGFIIVMLSVVILFGTYFLDIAFYQRLLKGTVKHALFIENNYSHLRPELSLSGYIGKESPIKWKRWSIRSTWKINIFYGALFLVLILFSLVMFFLGNETNVNANSNGWEYWFR